VHSFFLSLSISCAKKLLPSLVAHIDALQIEYSPWFTDHEQNGLIDAAKELGVSVIAFSPLGKGMLTGAFQSASDFKEGDFRKTIPRFSDENLSTNMRIVREFQKLAEKKGCTSGQLALAWVIAQGAIPIPGTKSAERLTENFGASDVNLSEEELKEIRKLVEEAKPQGNRYVFFYSKSTMIVSSRQHGLFRYNDAGLKSVGH
jgi:aryl-alcohol dehydrogenase-like predicted oxidoreductase